MDVRMRSRGAKERRGSVLVLSLVAVTTVLVLAASFSQFAFSVADRQAQAIDKKRAFYMAEAGLAEAYAGFTCGKSGNVGTPEAPAVMGHGVFWVQATELAPDLVRLESTGLCGSGRARLSLVAMRPPMDPAKLGVFSTGDVALAPGSVVDAYDSALGTYAAQSDKSGAAVGSNGTVQVSGTELAATLVQGNVTPGADQAVEVLGVVTISGSTTPALAPTLLPEVDVPEIELEPAVVHGSPYPLVVPAGRVRLDGLSVLASSQVILQGPAQVVLGSLALEAGAELAFDTSQGPVELVVLDGLDLAPESIVTTENAKPEDVIVRLPAETQEPALFRASSEFHGVIYAPAGAVVLGSGFEVFGAVVADSLVFDGAARLHFDRDLARAAAENAVPVMLSWRLVELGVVPEASPFDHLGVDPAALPVPAGAHADQELLIHYLDTLDVYHVYEGLESEFDWTVVKTVILATRDGVEVLFPRTSTKKAGAAKSPGVLPIVDGPMI